MRKILLVEDEDTLRDAYTMILLTQPYMVEVAKNGEEALELCKQQEFDLILLDLMMPRLDGVGFLQEFGEARPPRTKIIVLSNLSAGEELERALRLGANKSILKANMSPRQLLAAVQYELEA
jgi:two-component system chemotaxis response regulator CheY